MSATPPGGDSDRRFTRQIDDAFADVSRLAGASLPPTDFYQQFLQRALTGIDATAGAIWLRTPQGFLQVACQQNLEKIGLDDKRGGRQCHNEVLRHVFQSSPPRPMLLEPQGRLTGVTSEPGAAPAANLTDYYALFAPIIGPDKQSLGLFEVFQESSHEPRLYQTFLQYTLQMAGYASQYNSYASGKQQGVGSEKVYAQIEAFARLIHGTLNPTECAYHVANEGRRLIECDRLCVGVRHGSKATVEAVSGADVVEKASTHVRRMKALFDAVLKFNDKLTFTGLRDDSLPSNLLRALDDYLSESQPKLLVVQPIRDEREKDEHKQARAVMLMESFNPPEQTEPMIQRMEVVAKHAAPALYNAAEMKRIPFKFLWWPVIKLQDGIGGKNRFYAFLALSIFLILSAAMVFIPYPLKMEAKGQFKPQEEVFVFAPAEGTVKDMLLLPGQSGIYPNSAAVKLHSHEFENQIGQIETELDSLAKQIPNLRRMQNENKADANLVEVNKNLADAESKEKTLQNTRASLVEKYNLVLSDRERGFFYAKAPKPRRLNDIAPGWLRNPAMAGNNPPVRLQGLDPGNWTVLNDDNRNSILNRMTKPTEPMYRLGAVDGPWRAEIKIPQESIGHVMRAFNTDGMYQTDELPDPANPTLKIKKKYLPVDVLFAGSPDTSYDGKLYEADVNMEAVPNKDDHNESQPVVVAYVRIDLLNVTAAERKSLFVAGQGVKCKIRCGNHSLGYSMFHSVWEWFFEKVIFFF